MARKISQAIKAIGAAQIVVVLLGAIAVLLFCILQELKEISREMPYVPEGCGSEVTPCHVVVGG